MERSYSTDLSDASSLVDLPYTPTSRRLKPVLVRVRLEGCGSAWSSSVQLDSLKGRRIFSQRRTPVPCTNFEWLARSLTHCHPDPSRPPTTSPRHRRATSARQRRTPSRRHRAGIDTSSLSSLSSCEMELPVGFPVGHLGRNLLARHLAPSVSNGLLIQPPGLSLLLAACRPDSLPIGSVLGLQERPEEVKGYGQDDGGVLLRSDLAHRLKQPELQRRRALQTVGGLPEAL